MLYWFLQGSTSHKTMPTEMLRDTIRSKEAGALQISVSRFRVMTGLKKPPLFLYVIQEKRKRQVHVLVYNTPELNEKYK